MICERCRRDVPCGIEVIVRVLPQTMSSPAEPITEDWCEACVAAKDYYDDPRTQVWDS